MQWARMDALQFCVAEGYAGRVWDLEGAGCGTPLCTGGWAAPRLSPRSRVSQ